MFLFSTFEILFYQNPIFREFSVLMWFFVFYLFYHILVIFHERDAWLMIAGKNRLIDQWSDNVRMHFIFSAELILCQKLFQLYVNVSQCSEHTFQDFR